MEGKQSVSLLFQREGVFRKRKELWSVSQEIIFFPFKSILWNSFCKFKFMRVQKDCSAFRYQ